MPHDPESVVSMTSPKTFSPFLTSAVVFKTLLYQKKISELNCGLISLCILLNSPGFVQAGGDQPLCEYIKLCSALLNGCLQKRESFTVLLQENVRVRCKSYL